MVFMHTAPSNNLTIITVLQIVMSGVKIFDYDVKVFNARLCICGRHRLAYKQFGMC